MTQAIMQAAIVATKAVVWTVTVMATNINARTSGPSLMQLTFDWKAIDYYNELLSFEMEVKSIFMTKSCDISDSSRVPIIII